MSLPPHALPTPRTIAVIGGGMTGLASALALSAAGYAVTLYEKERFLGGLSASFSWEDVTWDRYYHVILSTDKVMLSFIRDIGLEDKLFWRDTKTGFYGKGRLVSFSSTLDFVRFPFISPWQKVRLAFGILQATRIKDPQKLDKIYVKTWLISIFGRRLYEQIWDPLLRSKLGAARERTSAAFIWATITRLYRARESNAKIEKMGHVQGGYATILSATEKILRDRGVEIRLAEPAVGLSPRNGGGVTLRTSDSVREFDSALVTTPSPEAARLLGEHLPSDWQIRLKQIEYLRVVCVSLILRRPLSPYYVTNLLDGSLPFTGVIEATNIVAPADLGGKHLIYLPKYMPEGDATFRKSDADIIDEFTMALKRVFPNLRDDEILHRQIFREKYVQPLQELNYLDRAQGFASPLESVFLVNTSMIYNSTLNNNSALTLARDAVGAIVSCHSQTSHGR